MKLLQFVLAALAVMAVGTAAMRPAQEAFITHLRDMSFPATIFAEVDSCFNEDDSTLLDVPGESERFSTRSRCPEDHVCCRSPKGCLQKCPHADGVCCPNSEFCCPGGHVCIQKSVGIVHCGRIGSKAAKRAAASGQLMRGSSKNAVSAAISRALSKSTSAAIAAALKGASSEQAAFDNAEDLGVHEASESGEELSEGAEESSLFSAIPPAADPSTSESSEKPHTRRIHIINHVIINTMYGVKPEHSEESAAPKPKPSEESSEAAAPVPSENAEESSAEGSVPSPTDVPASAPPSR